MSYSFVPEADRCPFWHIATTWAKISWTPQEFMNSSLNFTQKSLSISSTWLKVTTRMVIFSKHSKFHNPSMIQPPNRRLFYFNLWSVTNKIKSSMPNLCSVKVNSTLSSQPRRLRYCGQLRMHSLQRGKTWGGKRKVCKRHECDRLRLRNRL